MEKIKDILENLLHKKVKIVLDDTETKLRVLGNVAALTNAEKQAIAANKPALIELLKKTKTSVKKPIPTIPESSNYAISATQRRIWLLSQFEEESVAYNMSYQVELPGSYDLSLMERAIYAVIERHEILRTVFQVNDQGEIRQVVRSKEASGFAVYRVDCRTQVQADQEVKALVAKDSIKKFDLEHGPLIRVTLFLLTDDRLLLHINLHHIVCDGWSLDVLSKDIKAYYQAFSTGEEACLMPLSIQFKDYAAWHNERLQSREFQQHKAYWRQRLAGDLPLVDLPGQLKRTVVKTFNGRSLATSIDANTTKRLQQFCRNQGSSLFAGLQAALNVLLYRYTGLEDIIVGTSVAGRNHVDLEHQIGFYVNTLPLRNQINGSDSFTTFIQRVKTATYQDFGRQMYAFDRLVEDLDLNRDASRNAVFDVMLELHNTSQNKKGSASKSESVEAVIDRGSVISKMDLEIAFVEQDQHLHFGVVYNINLYAFDLIERFMKHFKVLLQNLLSEPEMPIGKVNFLLDTEEAAWLSKVGKKQKPAPAKETVPDLFEQLLSTHASKTAITFQDQQWTFSELEQQVNALANDLQTYSEVKTGDLVGICLERSDWTIISMLAAWKAGAAFVPMDPAFPQERLAYMQADSGCKPIVDATYLQRFKANRENDSTDGPFRHTEVNDLAYVIYTSGTTGKPKGVMITHQNLVSFASNFKDEFGFSAVAKIAGSSHFSFDIAMLEVLALCTAGIEMHLFEPEVLADPERLLKGLEKAQIELLQITPSRLTQFYEYGQSFPECLQLLLVGGEAMTTTQYDRLKQEDFKSLNVYGPTETTIWSSMLDLKQSNRLSIGNALNHEQLYILNAFNAPQPDGIPGELCIGGLGVGAGYLNRPELTHQKFIQQPFATGTIYKTGDLARRLPDGTIEFLGRMDSQVKIRGYRIELGEIEHVLLEHPSIDQAAVLVHEGELQALLCAKLPLNTREIKAHLSQSLPAYMLPAHWVQVDALPLNSNNKIDRNRLPDLIGETMKEEVAFVAPRTALEQALASVWKQVLRKEEISVKDDFYNLGGNSMKTVQVVSALKQRGYQLKIEQFLKHAVLEDLAPFLQIESDRFKPKTHRALGQHKDQVTLSAADYQQDLEWANFFNYSYLDPEAPHLIVIHEGTGEIQGYRQLCEQLKDDYNIWAFVLDNNTLAPQDLPPEAIAEKYAKTLEELFTKGEPLHLLGWSYGGYIGYLMANYFEEYGRALQSLVMIDTPDYVDFEYEGSAENEYFTEDYRLSVVQEKALMAVICPALDQSSLSADLSVDEFWIRVERIIHEANYDFQVPPFWGEPIQHRYGNLDLRLTLKMINQLRTIGLHIPEPHQIPLNHTAVIYVKAKASAGKNLNYWKTLTNGSFEALENDGDHGSVMLKRHIKPLAVHLIEQLKISVNE